MKKSISNVPSREDAMHLLQSIEWPKHNVFPFHAAEENGEEEGEEEPNSEDLGGEIPNNN